jgi:hypothetical protein
MEAILKACKEKKFHGEVIRKAAHYAAGRERFTVADVTRSTKIPAQSIQTALRRLVDDKYVLKVEGHEPNRSYRPGRPPTYYTLTANPDKQQEFFKRYDIILANPSEERTPPAGAHYRTADRILRELERNSESLDRLRNRFDLLEKHLRLAAFEEGLEEGKGALIEGYFLELRGRMAAVNQNRLLALQFFMKARVIYEANGIHADRDRIDSRIINFLFGGVLQSILKSRFYPAFWTAQHELFIRPFPGPAGISVGCPVQLSLPSGSGIPLEGDMVQRGAVEILESSAIGHVRRFSSQVMALDIDTARNRLRREEEDRRIKHIIPSSPAFGTPAPEGVKQTWIMNSNMACKIRIPSK